MRIHSVIQPGNKNSAPIFWGEIAPCEHLVQDQKDKVFLDALEGFVAGGLKDGDGVVVIATPAHLKALDKRLKALEVDIDRARSADQYITLDAQATLAEFMRNGWPDAALFNGMVTDLLKRAGAKGRKVRAFGEMVALLWEQKQMGATVQLEQLWHSLCRQKAFTLFCAYPAVGFTHAASESIDQIRSAHTQIFDEQA